MAKLIENGIEMSLKRMLSFSRYTTAYKVIHELPKKYYRYYLLSFFFLHVQKMNLCTYVHIHVHISVIMEAI